MATVFFDENANRWKAEVCVDKKRVGKRFKNETEAKKWAAKTETELHDLRYVDLADARKATLESLFIDFKKDQTRKRRTQSSSESEFYRINKILKYDIVKISLAKLTKADVNRFIEQRRATPSRNGGVIADSSIKREIDILRSVVEYAKDVKHIQLKENVFSISRFSHIERLKKTKRDRVFVDNEKQIFINEIRKNRNKQYIIWFEFVLETGLRKAESVAIKWKDWKIPLYPKRLHVTRVEDKKPSKAYAKAFEIEVDQTKERVFKDETKNGKSAYIPLSPRAIEILEQLHKKRSMKCEFIFDKITYSSLSSAWTRIKNKVGDYEIEDFHLHDLRHIAITNIAADVNNAFDVRTAARHSTIDQSADYVHSDVDAIAEKLRIAHEKREAAKKPESDKD
jgi:integrase